PGGAQRQHRGAHRGGGRVPQRGAGMRRTRSRRRAFGAGLLTACLAASAAAEGETLEVPVDEWEDPLLSEFFEPPLEEPISLRVEDRPLPEVVEELVPRGVRVGIDAGADARVTAEL